MSEADGWREEMRSAYLYRVVAEVEAGTPRQALFNELAAEADGQAAIWAGHARSRGLAVPQSYAPDVRTRIVEALLRRIGPRPLRSVLAAMKVRGMSIYAKEEPGHHSPGAGVEHRHRGGGLDSGGNLRAAVFGVNDGLISNTSLILGIAGATADNGILLLTGVAGLAAGAFSMAAGEYVSVRSQREMFEYQIGLEREELEHYPDEEAEELALIYAARGIELSVARQMAKTLIADPEQALDTLAREELGLNPDDLGSPWGAAIFSFTSFAVGAAIPLVPFLVAGGPGSLFAAIALSAAALFGVGAAISLFTGRGALASGARMLAIGSAAGAVTWLLGRLLGVTLA